ncbi:MAG: penicillin acylase family protein [Balneolales bacterium]
MATYLTFYTPLPNYSKDIQLDGVQNEVTVHRDDYGVPHIFAEDKGDLYFALGYVHAQDRIWQMTLSQMTAEGRFSEFLGEDFINLDKYLRLLGFQNTADEIWEELPREQQIVLESYAAGINSFASQNKSRLPIEFSLTGMSTIPWEPQHSIALSRIMAWEMNTSWWSKAVIGYLQESMEPGDFEELFSHFPDTDFIHDDFKGSLGEALLSFLDEETQMRKLFGNSGDGTGGNAWVASGSITESDYPLLAGDPHLGLGMPAKWFEVHLNLNGRNASGITIPGAPAIVIGQNDFMAWSLTNVMADETDFFIEKLHPNDTTSYLADSLDSGPGPEYEKLRVERGIIKVKNNDEILNEIRYTGNGPVISDIHHEPGLLADQMITMRWTGHEPSYEWGVLLDINWAESFNEFQSVLPDFKVPGMNILYGDVNGNISMHVLGNFPQRSNPLNFRRGWSRDDDWQGYIPFQQLPHIVNPESGYIANANNKLHGDDYPFYISSFWSSSFRFDRIESLLQGETNLNSSHFMDIQNDIYSNHAREVTELILPILAEVQNDQQIVAATSYLTNWDFNYAVNAGAASILDVFYIELGKNIIKKELGETAYKRFIETEHLPVRTLNHLLQESFSGSAFSADLFELTEGFQLFQLVDPSKTPGKFRISEDDILNSMKDAMTFLEDTLGPQSYEWRWENLHTLTLEPPLFGQAAEEDDASKTSRLIAKNLLSRGPYPMPGHGMTISKGQYSWEKPFEMTLGASQRRIVDFSDLQKSFSIISTGQSGNPLSKHYDDQLQLWLDGQYRTFYHHQDEIENFSNKTMTIKPL